MKFQYIRASFSPQGRTYLMPETLTRYYYRKDIVLEHSDHTIEIDYPFAFELSIDGQLIPARTGEKIHFLPMYRCAIRRCRRWRADASKPPLTPSDVQAAAEGFGRHIRLFFEKICKGRRVEKVHLLGDFRDGHIGQKQRFGAVGLLV